MPCAAALAVLLILAGLTGPGCDRPRPQVDYFSWTNPVTGQTVRLPEGWRQDPEAAREGETAIGYFAPNFSRALRRYGHVTLHHEDLSRASGPMTLPAFVDAFVAYMRPRSEYLSEPVFEQQEGIATARLSLEVRHQDREVTLRTRFWTANGQDYWYTVTEYLLDDAAFAERAAPLIERLQGSTLRPN